MFKKWKERFADTSKEAIKEEIGGCIKHHAPEILQGATLLLLAYICIKVNGKPINININLNNGM